MISKIQNFLRSDKAIKKQDNYLEFDIENPDEALQANAVYYNNKEWAEEYFIYVHRSDAFKSRWHAAIGDITDKVVVDIGCGPGNLFATLDEKPKVLIGVDVASVSLEMAAKLGYIPVLADAHNLPFVSGFADVVTLNATLHHCQNMDMVLAEAARLVKPGGYLITDHDPQFSAWNYKGFAKLLWNVRLLLYRIIGHGFHKTWTQQYWGLKSEVHHKPGHGVSKSFFEENLIPKGFTTNIYPHNHKLGADVFQGNTSKADFKFRMANILSGRNPSAPESALSLMCIARKSM